MEFDLTSIANELSSTAPEIYSVEIADWISVGRLYEINGNLVLFNGRAVEKKGNREIEFGHYVLPRDRIEKMQRVYLDQPGL